MDQQDLDNRFIYHPADTEAKRTAHETVRESCLLLATYLNVHLPEGREKAAAIEHLECTMFWANAAIARQ